MAFSIAQLRHPIYLAEQMQWQLWRDIYEGGDHFVRRYLQRFTNRESSTDFQIRRSVTPIPAFAKGAVNDIRNSIYQRMHDVTRRGGSKVYQEAMAGQNGGVDLRGDSIESFLGFKVLTELLIMGRAGVYVDMPKFAGETLAETHGARPYLYLYPIEDILSWTHTNPSDPNEFQAVLLRDTVVDFGSAAHLPVQMPQGTIERYRFVYINPETNQVTVQFYNMAGEPINQYTNTPVDSGPIELELTKIPFTMLDVGDSLLKDVSRHQIALLNLGSSDVAYALKANFPFYTEQVDLRATGDHLKHETNPDNTAMAGGQPGSDAEVQIGATQGRAYDLNTERPGFIHPSSEPLEASIQLQEKLEDDIRKIVSLSVANKIGRPVSGESKEWDNQALEAGLSFIGMVLENCERKIAGFWAAYEDRNLDRQDIPVIKYPARYNLKKDEERLREAEKLSELITTIPGRKVKRELAKVVVETLLSGKISVDNMEVINKEIDSTAYTTSDPNVIIQAQTAGLCGEKVASMALGFEQDEYIQAREDHLARIERIAMAQTKGEGAGAEADSAARGLPDLSVDPKAGVKEKETAKDTTMKDSTKPPVRGKGKKF